MVSSCLYAMCSLNSPDRHFPPHIWRLKGMGKNPQNITPSLKNMSRKCWSWESSYLGNSFARFPLWELDLCLKWLLLQWASTARCVTPAKCTERESWIWHGPVSWEWHLHESHGFICLNASPAPIPSLGKARKARLLDYSSWEET